MVNYKQQRKFIRVMIKLNSNVNIHCTYQSHGKVIQQRNLTYQSQGKIKQ